MFPASEFAIQVVNYLVSQWLPPHILPKMSFEEGIPDEFRTLVVVPMMLLTPDSIHDEVAKLEVRYLANPDGNLYFALLSDFSDAPQPEMPEDEDLLRVATRAFERQLLARALEKAAGSQIVAAAYLGVPLTTLKYKCKKISQININEILNSEDASCKQTSK